MDYWKRGQRAEVARAAGISRFNLSDILHRRKGVSPARAIKLEEASEAILGEAIPRIAWVYNRTTKHPAFSKV